MQSDAFKMLPDQQHALKVSKAKLPMVQLNGPLSDLQLYTLVSNNIKRTLIKGFFLINDTASPVTIQCSAGIHVEAT